MKVILPKVETQSMNVKLYMKGERDCGLKMLKSTIPGKTGKEPGAP